MLNRLSGAYCMDVIAGAAFGIHVDSLHNPKEQFVTHGRNIIKPRILVIILFCRCIDTLCDNANGAIIISDLRWVGTLLSLKNNLNIGF